jgi:hypothetical protein
MEQVPHWLEAAVSAAGVTTVYNAEDWDGWLDSQPAGSTADASSPSRLVN